MYYLEAEVMLPTPDLPATVPIQWKLVVINKHSYVDYVEAVNFNFSDAGLFGLKVQGAAENVLNITILGQRYYHSSNHWTQVPY